MKKVLILALITMPFFSQAQEIGLAENYKTKKEKRLEKFKPYTSGDVIINAGFSQMGRFLGLGVNFGGEYMINKEVGIQANYSTNKLGNGLNWGGVDKLSVDISYHFIQKKRWDVYAFAGIGAERFRYRFYQSDGFFINKRPLLNAGVGARYKVTPSFGIQAELSRVSSNIGVYKKFSLKRKK